MRAIARPPRGRFRRWSSVAAAVAVLMITPSVLAAPGAVTSYPTPDGATPDGVAVAPDGDVWFTMRSINAIGRLNPVEGSVETVSLGPGSGPLDIAAATDGSVWFTMPDANAIGRLTATGDLVAYSLPAGASPAALAAGPDGSVWYTDDAGMRLGRIAATGASARWRVPDARIPAGLTVTSDGTVWFASRSAPGVLRFDVWTESFTAHDLVAGAMPSDVAIDGGGDVWVTLEHASAVAKVDADTGHISTIDLAPGAAPTAITVASDGVVWVAQMALGSLVSIAPVDGSVATTQLTGAAGHLGLAADQHNGVWVADASAARISLVRLDDQPPPPSDTTAPTIELRSPSEGSWTVPGVPLIADYACADEDGGSGLASCDGPTPSGGAIEPPRPGAHAFEVVATDAAGNRATSAAPYLAFSSANGTALGGTARAGTGLMLSLGMALGQKADPGIGAWSTAVDCATGSRLGVPEPADLRDRVAVRGSLEARWLTSKTWAGSCRTLTVGFAADGWSGASATFGVVAFADGPPGSSSAKR